MKDKIIVANWKMNKNLSEVKETIKDLLNYTENTELKNVHIYLSPSYPFLHFAYENTKDTKVKITSQNIAATEKGAFTGEVSAEMVTSVGIKTTLVGHSERRSLFGETEEIVLEKIKLALKNKLSVILCLGESREKRENQKHLEDIKSQLENTLFKLSDKEIRNIWIAYEPVWAIGSGKVPTLDELSEMYHFLNSILKEKFGDNGENISLLYGGSVKSTNAEDILNIKNINGLLIGNASLDANELSKIIQITQK